MLAAWFESDAEFEVVCSSPTVKVGEEFEFVVSVTDLRGEGRRVATIDFEGDLTELVEVVAVDPPARDTTVGPWYVEHVFDRDVPASGTAEITYTLKAAAPGTVYGSVTVYDESYSWTEVPVTIDVRED